MQSDSRAPKPYESRGDGVSRGASAIDLQALEDIRQGLNEALKPLRIQLNFSQDKDLEQLVVKVMNHDTGEVIRQLPPENMLQMAKRMEELTGLLMDLQL